MQREELIEKFAMGELEGAELRAFENEMSADASLREEVQLQKDIVRAISENRRLAMKHRLDAIKVGASYTGYYIAAGISSVVIIGLMTFLSGIFDVEKVSDIPVETEVGTEMVETPADQEQEIETEELIPQVNEERQVQDSEAEMIAPIAEQSENDLPEVSEEESKNTVLPQIDKPIVPENDEEGNVVDTKIESPGGSDLKGAKIEVSKVQVEIDTDSEYNFHYRYFNNKLFLYGDFSSSPYELIELNSQKSKDLYMHFAGKYYALEANRLEITKLTPLRDKIIIRGLDNLR